MDTLRFRDLRAEEIDCRVGQIKESYLTLLLYKDARCDMQILDETVGPMRWQRKHERDNANCIVSIYDTELNTWISKEDTGTESNTDSAKGLASDSFKRACVNWGIGRELYTAPKITVWYNNGQNYTVSRKNNNSLKTYDTFRVAHILIKDKKITELIIINENTGAEVFSFGANQVINQQPPQTQSNRQNIQPMPQNVQPMPRNAHTRPRYAAQNVPPQPEATMAPPLLPPDYWIVTVNGEPYNLEELTDKSLQSLEDNLYRFRSLSDNDRAIARVKIEKQKGLRKVRRGA